MGPTQLVNVPSQCSEPGISHQRCRREFEVQRMLPSSLGVGHKEGCLPVTSRFGKISLNYCRDPALPQHPTGYRKSEIVLSPAQSTYQMNK